MNTRVYVVDSDALSRRGLVTLIGQETDMEVCGDAESAATALAAIVKLEPEVVTVEIWLNDSSGLELIKSIRMFNPRIGILAFSRYDETIYALRVLKAGARGFVSKQADSSKVLDAIRRIHNHDLYVSTDVENQMLTSIISGTAPVRSPVSGLSDREFEIGNLIGSGLETREIAGRLRVSVKTVESHRCNMKEKLGLPNAVRLQQFWIRWVDRFSGRPEPAFTFWQPSG